MRSMPEVNEALSGLNTPHFPFRLSHPVAAPLHRMATPVALMPVRRRVHVAPAVPNGSYRLDSGDQVQVIVFGQGNLSRVYSVDGSGHVALPLIGPVMARGLTTQELARVIARKLGTTYVKNPEVSVEVQTYRPFFILGQVHDAGQYPYVNGMTVQTAVAIAGGYTASANQKKFRLTRKVDGKLLTTIVPADYPVRPGDTIYVRERFF